MLYFTRAHGLDMVSCSAHLGNLVTSLVSKQLHPHHRVQPLQTKMFVVLLMFSKLIHSM